MKTLRPFDAEARAQTAEWLEGWAQRGPLLEARRVAELRRLTEVESARIAVELLWSLAAPGPGDNGEGLRALHEVLRRLAERA
ncbi:MAG: hypothetical protein ACRD3C_19930 [Vicinamibacterales bacterium]